jgi:hypothetical protein
MVIKMFLRFLSVTNLNCMTVHHANSGQDLVYAVLIEDANYIKCKWQFIIPLTKRTAHGMPNTSKETQGLQVQHTLLLCDYYQNGNVSIIFSQTLNIKFHENPFQS